MTQADSANTTTLPAAATPAAEKPRGRKSTGKSPAVPETAKSDPAKTAIDAVMTMIARAADAGQVDVVERLLAWRDKQIALGAERDFKDALAEAQEKMKPVCADAVNKHADNHRYASLAAMDEKVRGIYTAHGFGLTFDTEDIAKPDTVRLVCDVSHRNGHTRRYHLEMPADGTGPKGGAVMTRTHATGSAITYGRRYLLGMIFNLAVSRADDDDGNAAGCKPQQQRAAPQVNRQTPTYEQLQRAAASRPPTVALPPKHRLMEDIHPHPEDICERRGPVVIAREEIQKQARAAARQGREAANDFCRQLTKDQYAAAVEPILSELRELMWQAERAIPRHSESEMVDAAAADIAMNGWPQQPDDDLDIPPSLDRRTRR
jgi:hypothetical protein